MMKPDTERPLLAMLPVRNEAGRYLKTVLNRLSELVDGIVILDDASTDGTPELCLNQSSVIRYHRLKKPLFKNDEAAFRQMLWEMTVELEPGWIIAIDADEVFESGINRELPRLTGQNRFDLVLFTIYHFWGDLTNYRVDGLWDPALSKVPCLYRFHKNTNYHWSSRRLHCGRFPVECYQRPAWLSQVRLLHLGYVSQEEQYIKFQRYLTLDPKGQFCPATHYHSIITPPRLKQWNGERLTDIL